MTQLAATPNSSDKGVQVATLRMVSSGVVIVAHNEDTTKLRETLLAEGFRVEEVRGPYTREQQVFFSNYAMFSKSCKRVAHRGPTQPADDHCGGRFRSRKRIWGFACADAARKVKE